MTILRHELRQGLRTTLLWAVGCAIFVALGMSVYPRVRDAIGLVGRMVESMGPLAKAFAMDQLEQGEVLGYYAAQAGNILSLGGGLFAAILGISMLAKEEGRHTAEYLFPHPISRASVLAQKFVAVLLHLTLFSAITAGASWLSLRFLGEAWSMRDFLEMQGGIWLLMLCMACICWGVSAFLSRDSVGLGIGLALLMYFINLLINMEVAVPELRYLTPYYFTDASKLLGPQGYDPFFLQLGLITAGIFFLVGTFHYLRKDLRI